MSILNVAVLLQQGKSNATQLTLRHVQLSLSGRYSCEVSADAPSFHTALVSGDMDIVGEFQTDQNLEEFRVSYIHVSKDIMRNWHIFVVLDNLKGITHATYVQHIRTSFVITLTHSKISYEIFIKMETV